MRLGGTRYQVLATSDEAPGTVLIKSTDVEGGTSSPSPAAPAAAGRSRGTPRSAKGLGWRGAPFGPTGRDGQSPMALPRPCEVAVSRQRGAAQVRSTLPPGGSERRRREQGRGFPGCRPSSPSCPPGHGPTPPGLDLHSRCMQCSALSWPLSWPASRRPPPPVDIHNAASLAAMSRGTKTLASPAWLRPGLARGPDYPWSAARPPPC